MTLKFEHYYDTRSNFIDHYRHGEDHRLNGPSSLWRDGDMLWYQYGKLHRLDGPAEIVEGRSYYHINDVEYTKEEYYNDPKVRTLL